jgi:hypothetical protein
MSKRLSRISKDNPDLAGREDVKGVAQDIDIYAALKGFASSEAGAILIDALTKEIAGAVNDFASGYRTLPEIELRSLGARIDARLEFLRSLNRAGTNLDLAEAYLHELTS